MLDQGRSLRVMLSMVTAGLTQPEQLMPMLESCGRRHLSYRVEDRHYDTVQEALIWTLEQTLREIFTPEVREAWIATYGLMAQIMKDAAAEEAASLAA